MIRFSSVSGFSSLLPIPHPPTVGATNLPWELDEAVLRRFVRRIYIPLPDPPAREALIRSLFTKQQQHLPSTSATAQMIQRIVNLTEGYSASDITAVRGLPSPVSFPHSPHGMK
jgi:MoxR-like ATPase